MKVLTYNVGLLRIRVMGLTVMEPAPFVEQRAPRLAAALRGAGADIVALQEIYKRRHKEGLIDALRPVFPFHWHAHRRGRLLLDSGLMLLSRWPILDSGFERFAVNTAEEMLFTDRGILWAEIETDCLGRVRVVTFHTTAGGVTAPPEASVTDRRRDRQVDQIHQAASAGKGPSATVVMGDLNAGPGASAANYRRLLELGYVDAVGAATGGTDEEALATWDPALPLNRLAATAYRGPQRIDHVFVAARDRGRLRPTAAEIHFREADVPIAGGRRVTLSDHYAVSCTFGEPA